MSPSIVAEIDVATRQARLDEVTAFYQGEYAYVPLNVQPLVSGVRDTIELTERLDNIFILRWVTAN